MPTPEEFRDQFSLGWEDWLNRHFDAQDEAREIARGQFDEEWGRHLDVTEELNKDFFDSQFDPVPMVPRLAPFGQFPPDLKGAELPYGALNEFLFGQAWLFVTSTWVRSIQYHDKNQDLTVEFLNGAVCQYPGITVDEAMDFATAPSKGRWIHQHLIPRNDYVLLSVGVDPGTKPEAKSPRPGYRDSSGHVAVGPRQINRFTMRKLKPGEKRSYKPGSMGRGPLNF